MKILKVLFGWLCLLMAIFPGTFLLSAVVSGFYTSSRDLPLTFSVVWLACTGMFLLVQRNAPQSRAFWIRFGINLILCVAFFVIVAIPQFIRARSTSSVNACVNNLRQIDAAANQFALEHHLVTGAPIHFPDDLTPYIKLNSQGKIPSCPNGGIYHLDRVGENPTCSLSNLITPAHYLP